MLSKEETIRLQTTLEALPDALELILYKTEDNEFGRQLESFVNTICRTSEGKIRALQASPEAGLPASPCFRICHGERRNIAYAAVPEEHQFAPFLKALESFSRNTSLSLKTSSELAQIIPPVEIWVLVSSQCPRCPSVVKAAVTLSSQCPSASLFIIDAQQFPNLTGERGIKAVPATVIDRQLVLIGDISTNRLVELVRIRGTDQFDEELMRSFIERGRIGQAAEQLRQGKGRTTVLSLVQELDMSARMSGLVVLDKALENDPAAVREMVPSLIELLSHQDSRIRGDIADILSKVGDQRAIPPLERLAGDLDVDVAEAAAEALELIRGQQT